MAELAVETREALESGLIHPLMVIGSFVVRFLAIHPFQDGNGRLSRALTTLLLLRSGYSYVPYASLESIIEENKESYYLALRRTQGTFRTDLPDGEPWLLFFVRALHTQKSRLERKIEREQLLEGDLPELSVRILELARERGRVTSAEILTLTGEKPTTVRNRLTELQERGLLSRHGKARATWYTLHLPH
jgi:Fic family protein